MPRRTFLPVAIAKVFPPSVEINFAMRNATLFALEEMSKHHFHDKTIIEMSVSTSCCFYPTASS